MLELTVADRVAAAFFDAIGVLAAASPSGRAEAGSHGSEILISGAPMAGLNGVFTRAREADPAEIARLAARMARAGVPWSIQVRGAASAEVAHIAAQHGLTGRSEVPLLAVTAAEARLGRSQAQHIEVRRVGSAARDRYNALLAAGFDAPREMFDALMTAPVLDAPGAVAYLAERDPDAEHEHAAVPVATGYALRTGEYAGVFNIATPPSKRGHGYGRLVTETLLADAFAAGVTVAYLQPTQLGRALYDSMGFTTVEHWTYFQA